MFLYLTQGTLIKYMEHSFTCIINVMKLKGHLRYELESYDT